MVGDEAYREFEEFSERLEEQKRIERIEEKQDLPNKDFSHVVLHDALTGLPNRSYLFQQIQFTLEKSKLGETICFCVLFTDLNCFKSVNDCFGHDGGDEVLILIG